MNQSKWDLTTEIDWDKFGSGEKLTFVRCMDEARKTHDGDFTSIVTGFFDEQGRFFIVGTEVIPNKFGEEKK
jgi:hypothetical protein